MADDPYKYFRIEGRELLDGMTAGVLGLEKGQTGKEPIGRLLRLAHTLKGAARIVKQPEMSRHAHAMEDVLAPYREGGSEVPRDAINQLLDHVDAIAAGLRALPSSQQPAGRLDDQQTSPPVQPPAPERKGTNEGQNSPPPAPEVTFEHVRIEIGQMDSFLRDIAEAGIHAAALSEEAAAIQDITRMAQTLAKQMGARQRRTALGTTSTVGGSLLPGAQELLYRLRRYQESMASGFEKSRRELARLHDRASELRLLPTNTAFPALERAARDAADALGKQVRFQASGGEQRIDAHVLRLLRDALAHVIRNAVAHGIETPEQRLAAGKPVVGLVQLHVERRGGRMAFVCRDDGQGVDLPKVRQVATERKLVTTAQAATLQPHEAMALLLRGGVSTAGVLTEVSGRGVGLDVVRETMRRLKGEVTAHSESGRGTTVDMCVPLSLESLAVLEIKVADMAIAIPLDAVQQVLRLQAGDLAVSTARTTIMVGQKPVPFLPLTILLRHTVRGGGSGEKETGAHLSAVVLRAGNTMAAIGVDRVLGQANAVVRPLPPAAGQNKLIAGASLDLGGHPRLMLDPAGVIEAVHQGRAMDVVSSTAASVPLLIVDDSLTTRMLEQSILETAGYHVDLAVSGEEGLAKAREKRYGLFIVDVEMPGINGFEFVRQVRADPQLQSIPAILVTSLSSPEDRLRGQRAGAQDFMVKSEFDERRLLQTIQRLLR